MSVYALLFTLAAVGVSEVMYLLRTRYAEEEHVCLIGEDCTKVLTSSYHRVFFIPTDILGLFFYVSICFITAFLMIGVEPLDWWDKILKVFIAGGAILSIFFTYVQAHKLHAWCFWCLLSATITWVMALIILGTIFFS